MLSLKRDAADFGGVTADETKALADIVAQIESRTRAAFQYDKINYLMLMMVDPHVHFHVIPRYAAPRNFAGRQFADTGWPAVPSLAAESSTDDELQAIRAALRV
ncbi:MAG: hypothetical protein R3A47_05890 [Polyangiales bacterium]